MSVTKTQETKYHETDQPVKYKLAQLVLRNLDDLKSLTASGKLIGKVGDAPGEVADASSRIGLDVIKDNFSAAEKTAARTFVAAIERELALAVETLAEETHDDTDVFVDNS